MRGPSRHRDRQAQSNRLTVAGGRDIIMGNTMLRGSSRCGYSKS